MARIIIFSDDLTRSAEVVRDDADGAMHAYCTCHSGLPSIVLGPDILRSERSRFHFADAIEIRQPPPRSPGGTPMKSFQNSDRTPEPAGPGFPAVTVANVEMALIVGARTPTALARLFGIDPQSAADCGALHAALADLMKRGTARWMERPDDKLVVLLAGETERPYDDVRRKPSPRPRPEA